MCVAAAIAGAAVVGAAGTAIAGHQASSATRDATNAAVGVQQQALNQQKQLAAPYTALGQAAIPQLQNLLGLGKGGTAGIETALSQMPGYQFAKGQGIQDTTNAASAMGLGISGNTLEGIQKFGTGLADQTYQQQLGDVFNTVGLGQAAAAGQAANIGNTAGNVSNLISQQGQTLAGIDANTAAGLTKAIGGGVDNAVMANTLNNLSLDQQFATAGY